MCGIAGFVGRGDASVLGRMTELLRHRGPDDSGTWLSNESPRGMVTGLGHRRLSIIDLTDAGHQPMFTPDGRYGLVYNGEVYNFADLREELIGKGCTFRSKTDTEVLLHGYAVWQEGVLDRLNGMFAFAIWDSHKNELFLARDRLGIKPLYHTHVGDEFIFASEIKALLQYPGVRRAIDHHHLHEYLSFLWVPDPGTMFKGIDRLPAGHYAVVREGRANLHRWWDCDSAPNGAFSGDEQACRRDVLQRLRLSVSRRLMSDVPLGAFLSGGVDSSAIVSLMAKEQARPSTYSVGFTADDLRFEIVDDDLRYARVVAQTVDTDHHEIILKPDVIEVLPRVIWHMDEPVADPAAISAYLICQAARDTVTVMLNGQGADEIFAGYPRHVAVRYAELYNLIPAPWRKRWIPRLIQPLHASGRGRASTFVRNMKKFTRSAGLPFHDRYIGYLTHFTHDQKLALYSEELREELSDVDAAVLHHQHWSRASDYDLVNQMCYLDLKTFLPSLNLMYTDKMSMAHSVEVRVPFLDHELVEAAMRIPARLKVRGAKQKYILKRALSEVLPRSILTRSKAGFTAPIRGWLRGELRPLVDAYLSKEVVGRRGLFNADAVNAIIREHRSGREDNAWKIWQLITLEHWMRTFLDADGSAPVEMEMAHPSSGRSSGTKRGRRKSGGIDVIRSSESNDRPSPSRRTWSRRHLWEASPRIVRRTAGPILGMFQPQTILGRRFRRQLHRVEQMQNWSGEQAGEFQLAQLRKVCRRAEQTPYYREIFKRAEFSWRDLKDVRDISHLPTVSRADIRDRLLDMCAVDPSSGGVDFVSTGGSEGAPLHFYIDADRSAIEFAYLVVGWRRAGYELNKLQAVLRGEVVSRNREGLYHEYDALLRRHSYSTFHMTDDNMRRYLNHIAQVGPCFLHVYPSSVLQLARFIQHDGSAAPANVRGILAGSENVYPEGRSLVEKVFGVRYFSWYGHSEKLVMGAECELSPDYHIWPTYGYFELIGDQGQSITTPGQRGEIVGTGFINTVMPFIRYRTGDYATYVAHRCDACGREHPLIKDIRGHRSHEMLVASDGSLISWTALNMHDRTFENVRQFQFVQNTPGVATLNVVASHGFSQTDRERILASFERKIGGRLDIDLRLTDDIPASALGKAIYVDQSLDIDHIMTQGASQA